MSGDKGRQRSKSKETSPDPRNVSKKMNFANLKIQSALSNETDHAPISSPPTSRVYEQILKEAYSNRSQKAISSVSSPPSKSLKSSNGFEQAKEVEAKKQKLEKEKVNLYKRLTTKPILSSDNGKILSNMLFFKQQNAETKRDTVNKQTEMTRADSRDSHAPKGKKLDNNTLNIKNYEAFWEQLLRDDQRESTPTSELNLNNIGDRQKLWMEMKNKKVDEQKKYLKNKEMSECTFQPVLFSKLSQEFQKNHESLYQKFLDRMTSGSHVTKSAPQTKDDYKLNFQPQSPKMFSPTNVKNLTTKNSDYSADMQSRLYNYILDSEKK